MLPALEAGSLNHWTAGEVPQKVSFLNNSSEDCISKKKKRLHIKEVEFPTQPYLSFAVFFNKDFFFDVDHF